jgi:hypothetical protein
MVFQFSPDIDSQMQKIVHARTSLGKHPPQVFQGDAKLTCDRVVGYLVLKVPIHLSGHEQQRAFLVDYPLRQAQWGAVI